LNLLLIYRLNSLSMKKYLAVLFVLLVGQSFAQKIRFTDSGNRWITHYRVGSDPTPYSGGNFFRIGNDTSILGHTYKMLIDSNIGMWGMTSVNAALFLSEDTINNKIFYWSSIDSNNHLLYDFNLGLGDSLVYTPGYNVDSVIAIDSIDIDGLFYKIFTMQLKGTSFIPQLFTFVEGVGCTDGLLWPLQIAGSVEYEEGLLCLLTIRYYQP